ncbi:MAG: hypothetical protein M3680_15075 [Myxococcota bacterium]|nr:hypothetical protein [Myxococcota bacterium]
MDQLLEAIRNATGTDASDEARAAGAQACRTILSALEAKPGEPLVSAGATMSPIAAAVSVFRGMTPEQLLDLAIARLKAAVPEGTPTVAAQPVKFHLLPLPEIGRRS